MQLTAFIRHARKWSAQFVTGTTLALGLVAPVGALPLAQAGGLEPSAPENLRCPGKPGPRDGYHFEAQWQQQATFAASNYGIIPHAVALDHACNSYVTDTSGNRIVKYGPDGAQLGAFTIAARTDPTEGGPNGVAVDPTGNIYVADSVMSRVRKLSPDGKEIAVLGTCVPPNCDPNEPDHFVSPEAVAVDGSGSVYVLDSANDRVQRFSPDGKVLKVFGSPGEGPGQMQVPSGIALDRQGNVYIADTGNDRIEKFSADGLFVAAWGSLGAGGSQFHNPVGIAVDEDGNMYVSDLYNWRVAKLSPDGQLQEQWPECPDALNCTAMSGDSPGEFFDHRQLTVDGQGNIYVADGGNLRVQRRIVVEVPNPPPADQSAAD